MKKGHDHPLIGGSDESPQLALKSTYTISETPLGMLISIKRKRAAIGVYVENRGFSFFGFSPRADKQMDDLWARYLRAKVKEIFQ